MRWQARGAVTVVTGASSGIGWSLCQSLVRSGATVVACARREDRLLRLRDELQLAVNSESPRLIPVVGDVTEPAVRENVIQQAAAIADGRLDLLVNNAGVGAIGPFATASPERLRRIFEVNFFAPLELTRLAIPLLRRGRNPVICNMSSVLGHRAVPNKSEYCASKFALHGWSDSLRAELAGDGIQVTLVSPSTTESEFFDVVIQSDPSQTAKNAGSARYGAWTPARVARATLTAISLRRSEVILSLGGKALVYADRLSPPLVNLILAQSAGP